MKRIATISLSVMLSVVIIALGAGIAFVRCCHTKTMELAQLTDAGHHGAATDDECCAHHKGNRPGGTQISEPDCMETVIVKLAPTMTFDHSHVAFHTLYFPLSTLADFAGGRPLPFVIKANARHTAEAPHSPPRHYLRLIRILLI